ncbi:MAG: TIGR00645 family protein [Nitrospirota bacterium]|nr:TIGR00645 family protein [Nitrospirota bacterium]
MKRIERVLETVIFNSRWLLAPFYLGLSLAIGLLLVKFGREFLHIVPLVLHGEGEEVILGILSLVDVALVANLLLIIVFAGYENFVSHIHTENHEDRPEWMGHVDFADLKIKLIGSIVAISAIELLKAFVNLEELNDNQLAWKVGIHLTLVFSGVMFALMDRLGVAKKLAQREHRDH